MSLFQIAASSCKCGALACLMGSVGMFLGQLVLPTDHHVLHHGSWTGIILSGMTVGMLVMCLAACRLSDSYIKPYAAGLSILLHLTSLVMMFFGMVYAAKLAFLNHVLTDDAATLIVINLYMIAGMGVGAAAGYFLPISAIKILSESAQLFTSNRAP